MRAAGESEKQQQQSYPIITLAGVGGSGKGVLYFNLKVDDRFYDLALHKSREQ